MIIDLILIMFFSFPVAFIGNRNCAVQGSLARRVRSVPEVTVPGRAGGGVEACPSLGQGGSEQRELRVLCLAALCSSCLSKRFLHWAREV